MPLHFMFNSNITSSCGPFTGFLFRARGSRFGMLLYRKFQESRLQSKGNGRRPTHLFPQVRRNYPLRRLKFQTELNVNPYAYCSISSYVRVP